ncbi:hypothetical protein [Oceanisphaera sp. IT1-181]|uniref:hypothetical protein n=1 Tax=Oceanisphaera sp. IT1-181 TaxID=3081199 RepID=UPI0029C9F04E|nr:hypothetical protein [Oceanisphaera sp. IT1-181]
MDTRINVTLPEDVFLLLNELAELRSTSRASVLREFLAGSAPAIQSSITMIKMMHSATPEQMAAISKLLDSVDQESSLRMDTVQGILDDNAEPK